MPIQAIAIVAPPDSKLGPKMLALNQRQRKFVTAIMELGDDNFTNAAAAAGYEGDRNILKVTAYRLTHDPKVKSAMLEMAESYMTATSLALTPVLAGIAFNPQHKDQVKALLELMNRSGLHSRTEHTVNVRNESETDEALIARFKQLALENGIPVEQVVETIKGTGIVIDAEFQVVVPEVVEDWENAE